MRPQPFRFQKDLVRILVGETVNLVLDGRAIARPDALNDPGEQRRTVQTAPDELVGAFVGMSDPAGDLRRMFFH